MDDSHHDFGWQGIRLRVPSEWELGRVDGDMSSGYARLDDARMVRAEVEWRAASQNTATAHTSQRTPSVPYRSHRVQ